MLRLRGVSGRVRRVRVGRRQMKIGESARWCCRRRQAWGSWRAGRRGRLGVLSVLLCLVRSSSVEGVGLDGMHGMKFSKIGFDGCLLSAMREFFLCTPRCCHLETRARRRSVTGRRRKRRHNDLIACVLCARRTLERQGKRAPEVLKVGQLHASGSFTLASFRGAVTACQVMLKPVV